MVQHSRFLKVTCRTCLTIGFLCLAAPVVAEEQKPSEEVAQELDEAAKSAVEAAEHLIAALRMLVDNLPQYAAPEVLENGDILIRRLPSKSEKDGEAVE